MSQQLLQICVHLILLNVKNENFLYLALQKNYNTGTRKRSFAFVECDIICRTTMSVCVDNNHSTFSNFPVTLKSYYKSLF